MKTIRDAGENQAESLGRSLANVDAIAATYQPAWIRQIGTESDDLAYGIASEPFGNLYIRGQTQGALGGNPSRDWDIWFGKYDSIGTALEVPVFMMLPTAWR